MCKGRSEKSGFFCEGNDESLTTGFESLSQRLVAEALEATTRNQTT